MDRRRKEGRGRTVFTKVMSDPVPIPEPVRAVYERFV